MSRTNEIGSINDPPLYYSFILYEPDKKWHNYKKWLQKVQTWMEEGGRNEMPKNWEINFYFDAMNDFFIEIGVFDESDLPRRLKNFQYYDSHVVIVSQSTIGDSKEYEIMKNILLKYNEMLTDKGTLKKFLQTKFSFMKHKDLAILLEKIVFDENVPEITPDLIPFKEQKLWYESNYLEDHAIYVIQKNEDFAKFAFGNLNLIPKKAIDEIILENIKDSKFLTSYLDDETKNPGLKISVLNRLVSLKTLDFEELILRFEKLCTNYDISDISLELGERLLVCAIDLPMDQFVNYYYRLEKAVELWDGFTWVIKEFEKKERIDKFVEYCFNTEGKVPIDLLWDIIVHCRSDLQENFAIKCIENQWYASDFGLEILVQWNEGTSAQEWPLSSETTVKIFERITSRYDQEILLHGIKDQKFLKDFISKANSIPLRIAASINLKDEELLANIAYKFQDIYFTEYILRYKINDQKVLLDLCRYYLHQKKNIDQKLIKIVVKKISSVNILAEMRLYFPEEQQHLITNRYNDFNR